MMMTVHVNGIVYFVLGVQMMIRKVGGLASSKFPHEAGQDLSEHEQNLRLDLCSEDNLPL